jgi:diguanylate cyclase (GGDEF)-like protein
MALTGLLITCAAGLLFALLSSSTTPLLGAQVRLVFEPKTVSITDDYTTVARRLRDNLRDKGPSTSLVPDSSFWLLGELAAPAGGDIVLEIRHLRVADATFWSVSPSQNGRVTSELIPLEWQHSKGGISINIPANGAGTTTLLGEVIPRYPTVLKAFIWSEDQFQTSIEKFNRTGGALVGACAVLALTMGLLALRNRDLVAAMFGATILLMLRIAAFNSGWDMHWAGISVPNEAALTILRATLPLTAISQTVLFLLLFKAEVIAIRALRPTLVFVASFVALLLASPVVEHDSFLRAFWALTIPGAVWLILTLVRVLPRTTDRAARLYATALFVTLAGMLAEIAYMFGLWDTTVSASLLGVLIGAAVNAAAVAERLYADRAKATEAERRELIALKEKEDNFQESPVALFEFQMNGALRHSNIAFRHLLRTSLGIFEPNPSWDQLFTSVTSSTKLDFSGERASLEILQIRLERFEEPPEKRYVELKWIAEADGIRGSIQDVTDRELARNALVRLVDFDQLTDTLNVHGLIAKVSGSENALPLESYCLALIDIVRFDSINELFGHETGNVVLRTFAKRLLNCLRSDEFVARVGADTFALIVPNFDMVVAEKRVRSVADQCIRTPVAVEAKAVALSVCIGLVAVDSSVSVEQAIGASQRTIQRAKQRRSGAITVASETEEFVSEYLHEKRLLSRISDTSPRDNFFQLLQPIVSLRNPRGKFSCEALIRMRGDNGEVIPPARFISAAERNGIMSEIDRWTLETACQWLAENRDVLKSLEYVAVNVSGASLNDVRFHADVRSILKGFSVDVNKLCFEITESIAVNDIDVTNRFTDQLRSLGAKVALDDFGAGYTSFGYLGTIPADILKIDAAIIKTVATDSSSAAIVRAIKDLADDLGMRCVAEHVSNAEIVKTLRELDVEYGQGFVLSKPIPPTEIVGKCSGFELIGDAQVARYLAIRADFVEVDAGSVLPERNVMSPN